MINYIQYNLFLKHKKMERRLNKKLEEYIIWFKTNLKDEILQLNIDSINKDKLIKKIFDYDRLVLNEQDFCKRKRVKNVVPIYDRCCAKRASDQQCTRRRKEGSEYCGTHIKGTPHGCINSVNEDTQQTQKVQVWAQDIGGIIYYIDNNQNVYCPEDIMSEAVNPKIIAKYELTNEVYTIPSYKI